MPYRRAIPFAKGHGTENDFVLVPDPDGELEFTAAGVAAVCNRRSGIGADGLIRVVRASAIPEGEGMDVEWFMDYRNADGSTATMCANGLRVVATYLEHRGWITLTDGPIAIGTRAGIKRVHRDGHLLSTDIGPWRVPGGDKTLADGSDAAVSLHGETTALAGLTVDVGNPHIVVSLPNLNRLGTADLNVEPVVEPKRANGTNVELIVRAWVSTPGTGHLTMRIYERGVGETRSCGTGAVAAVLAARTWAKGAAPDTWNVDVPGGRLHVVVPGDELLAGSEVTLAGPAIIVAEGEFTSALARAALI